jgi:ubiquinone/menaquinone biosynthesis C-methylase UbiE
MSSDPILASLRQLSFVRRFAATGVIMATSDQGTSSESEPGVMRVFQSKSETKAFYDKIAKVYDLLAEHSEAPVRQAGLDKLAVREGEKVLEIGCGTGHCLVAIAKAVGPEGMAYGVDVSEEMLKHTQKRADQEQVADCVELHCGDAMHLPFIDGSMDGVFMSFTLELFDTPEIPQVLAECKRVLRPGGRIVVVGMSKEDAHGAIFQMYEWSHRHFPNFVDCRPIFVRRTVEAAGFSVSDAEKMSMWVPVEIVSALRL